MTDLSPVVLKNKGVPVDVYLIDRGEATVIDGVLMPPDPQRIEKGTGFEATKFWVRFNANVMADLEDEFGSMDGYNEALRARPVSTLRRTLALMMGCETRAAGLAMIEGNLDSYTTAVGVAFSIASGVDPTQAAEMLKVGLQVTGDTAKKRHAVVESTLKETREELDKKDEPEPEVEKAAADDASPGANGSKAGPPPEEALLSSGT